jgi:GT2 family glycosyltransferase
MFVRRRVFEAGFRFNEQVGPSAGNYIMGSETDFVLRAAAAGYSAWWCPDVQVHHIIHSEQLTRKWLFKRAYRHGKSEFFHNARGERIGGACSILGIQLNFPRFILRQAVEALISAVAYDIVHNNSGSLQQWWRFFHFAGYIEQARHG